MPLTQVERLSILRRVPFFSALADRDLQEVNRVAYEQSFAKDQNIFHQGDRGECLYIIASGHVRIYMSSSDAKLVTLRIYSTGAVFGEFAALDGEPRTAHAVAMTSVTTLVLSSTSFATLRQHYPSISEGVITVLLQRLRATTTFGQNMAFLGAVGKIATTLAHMAASLGEGANQIELNYNQGEIAAMAGVTREWVNKAYQEIFVPNDLIALHEKREGIAILNLERLREWEKDAAVPQKADIEAACAYARDQLAQLPKSVSYHSLSHTERDVVPEVERLSKQLKCTKRDRQLLQTAAWYHDIGYLKTRNEHEAASIQIVQQVLPGFGYTESDIARISAMIRATRIPQQPQNLLEQILVDADMVSIGRKDRFLMQSMALYEELNAHGQQIGLTEWFQRQHTLLSSYQFFTAPARELGDSQKQHNLAQVEQLLNPQ